MACRKFCTFFSLILALLSATGYACAYSVYTTQNNAVILQTAAEHTGVVLADSGMTAPKPESNEIKSVQQKQAVPLNSDRGFDFHACTLDFGYVLSYNPGSAFLLINDVYTQFENKYRDTVLTLQTFI